MRGLNPMTDVIITDPNDPRRRVFGKYRLKPNSGVNPPYSPAYPVEWGCTLRTVEIMTRVAPGKVSTLLADTPFEIASDRVAFRFMRSPGHSLAVQAGEMFDLMISVPVRYKGLFTETHIFMYCSDPMGICAGREVFGYTKKDAHYAFDEHPDGSITGWVRRRGIPLADFSFKPDMSAPVVRIVDGDELPAGEIHVRRLPHPERLGTAYADVAYRRTPLKYSAPVPGRASMTLHPSEYDPIADLNPEILGAHFMVSDVYGGGFEVEDRRLIERLTP
jgi:acetoacetate decarboxylase